VSASATAASGAYSLAPPPPAPTSQRISSADTGEGEPTTTAIIATVPA
jgi:hypothetical protein